MKLSVIIPFYADDSVEGRHRARLWAYLSAKWTELVELGAVHEVIVAADPLVGHRVGDGNSPRHDWSTARALHNGMKQVTGDAVTAFGADQLPDTHVLGRAKELLSIRSWTFLYKDVIYAAEAATRDLLDGKIADWQLGFVGRSGCCKGMWAWRREVWEHTGGVDPRFVGWGYGDDAWNDVLEAVYGPSPEPPGGDLRELWHPAAYRDVTAANPNQRLYAEEYMPHRGDREYMLAMRSRWES